ncbi:3-ketoacyl-CoA thiolase 2, peroxisomal [Dorcoceras hygrometricum]|uniref:3-ketoacyl-CoA thiolase 2, peroxisomal n=3 Tax=Dorcoceras hygrometricum TaxID=472368 RepID=A0A2Z7CVH4_9LAMI|nr:3-ketoacyl-CoA thiolase 2, peroxisomal [Dorcoceras hygrometricum]
MTFRFVRTNQYNQDLGLIHSTNGNHLESPNEGSSIDHQVTIYLHAQNITMFPTNETWAGHSITHHSSVVFRHDESVGHHSDDSVGPFRHDTSVCRSQRGSISIGYPRMSASGESSTTMHRLLHASGSHPIPPPNDPKDTASRGPTTIVAPESQFRTCPSEHDRIGYPRMSASGESSTTMHRLLHASGSHPIPTPYDPKRVGKRVKVRRLSRRVSMTFRVVRTNQYNQDLGLIHSTNGNHLESPNEGSSIDHQVTIYLHAQNITMFPTNETWYFASQILVSSSGGLILILTAQSTRNMFRIHSDY